VGCISRATCAKIKKGHFKPDICQQQTYTKNISISGEMYSSDTVKKSVQKIQKEMGRGLLARRGSLQ
jgi:hypothetical protein